MKYQLIFILSIFTLFSCTQQKTVKNNVQATDSLVLKYATGFSVNYYRDYKELIVYSPWVKGAVYNRYYLVCNNKTKVPENGILVRIPLASLVAASVTNFEFLQLLQETETITGVCSPDLIYNHQIRTNFELGKIKDLGDAFNINIEKTLLLQPSAVMMSGYNQDDPYAARVIQAGIPVLFNNEWMESSLLGRAEWIKFVAAFYNKEEKADSIFQNIESNYNSIKEKAQQIKVKPRIMAGSNFRGTWYMPAGRSFMGKLFADAGSDYFYASDTTSGSLPLNIETVLQNFSSSDAWLNCSFNSIEELIKADNKHSLFNPVKTHSVYNFNKRLLPSGANDFWESAVARPDLLLMDVISILHPELLPGYKPVYAEKLK